ncbi:hypothetical protein [Halomontanus rarus]|uniref:hypothetical protein n=1 Tax=Halomontanus rarus TaxID=3034020 RepID=UPI0023E85B0D|nr:hypothetical protein [Halovivax sp. TS33]
MRGPGIIQMLEIAAGLSISAPMFVVGFDFLRSGQLLFGVGMFSCGMVAMFLPSYLIRRIGSYVRNIGGPKTWVLRAFGRAGGTDPDPDPESTATADSQSSRSNSNSRSGLLGRFRND